MTEVSGLESFADRLHPDLRAEIDTWVGRHPLARLRMILAGHTAPKPFFDALAEAMVARRLVERGCMIDFEVATPSGRACDFAVHGQGHAFYLHLKRLDTTRPGRRRLTISSRLRALERVPRPYVVSVRWPDGAGDARMQRLVERAAEFIARARVGDEASLRDDDGSALGHVRIVAPWDGSHVSLHIGLPSSLGDVAGHMGRLLRRAYRQFMPRADNVILICSSHEDEFPYMATALLGTHVERWDEFPPRGRRIAHGRAEDGLWHGRRFNDSCAAGWFRFNPLAPDIDVRVMYRDCAAESLRDELERVFDGRGPDPSGRLARA